MQEGPPRRYLSWRPFTKIQGAFEVTKLSAPDGSSSSLLDLSYDLVYFENAHNTSYDRNYRPCYTLWPLRAEGPEMKLCSVTYFCLSW